MLDRIAGTSSQAAAFGASLHTLRQMEQQLADIASLGDEEERDELQQMIQEVMHGSGLMASIVSFGICHQQAS